MTRASKDDERPEPPPSTPFRPKRGAFPSPKEEIEKARPYEPDTAPPPPDRPDVKPNPPTRVDEEDKG